jgi:hypothetical protein
MVFVTSAGLMWGMVLFLAAFAFLFFWGTSLVTRVAAGVPLAFVVGMCVWCITDSWEQDAWWFKALFELLGTHWDRLSDSIRHISLRSSEKISSV